MHKTELQSNYEAWGHDMDPRHTRKYLHLWVLEFFLFKDDTLKVKTYFTSFFFFYFKSIIFEYGFDNYFSMPEMLFDRLNVVFN